MVVTEKSILNKSNIKAESKKKGKSKTIYLSDEAYELLNKYCLERNTKPSKTIDALIKLFLE